MIIPMKKATLHALKQDKEKLLIELQRIGEFMIVSDEEGASSSGGEKEQAMAQKALSSIKFVSSHQKKKPMLEPRSEISYGEFLKENPKAIELLESADKTGEELNSIKSEIASAKAMAQSLEPWLPLDIPLEKIKPTKFTRFIVGYMPPDSANEIKAKLESAGANVELLGTAQEGTAAFVAYHIAHESAVFAAINESAFTEAVLPRITGTAKGAQEQFTKTANELESRAKALTEKAIVLAEGKKEIQALYDKLNCQAERMAAPSTETARTFCLNGWVREDKIQIVEKAVASVTDAYALEFIEPSKDEIAPTCVVNKSIIAPFEAITNLYSRPSYSGLDPNALMAPFYFIFFGMMVSDAGYGLIMTIMLFAFNKIMKPKNNFGKLVNVLLFGSISTFIWGALFGGWLGFELPPILFVPMKDPISMLILCYAFGVIHIFTGMIAKMYMEFKRGNPWDAIFDQLTWMVMIVGLLMLALPQTSMIGAIMAIAAVATILITGGRKSDNLVGKITGGLGSLYGITSYLSDILSYSRLFALGLATGVIGMVINTICGMLSGAGIIGIAFAAVVMVGGHIFNIAINALGAYVHASRLQYIEFFGKFYESGGKEFKPLALNTKYIDVVGDAK